MNLGFLVVRRETCKAELYVTNIGNKNYRVFAENGTPLGVPVTTAIFGRPREWAVGAKNPF